MLALLRRKAQSPFIQATVVIIALVFIFWGVGTNQNGGRTEVATVNEEPIQFNDYQRAYDRMTSLYREQFGGNLPRNILENLDLKTQVIEQMIQEILLRQGAREMGLVVSNMEITQAIQKMEAFRTPDGAFDMSQYKAILSSSRMTPAGFEASMRSDLLSAKVMEYISRIAKVSPAESRNRFNYDNEEINLEYIVFDADDFKNKVEMEDEKILLFFEENQENYMTAPRIKTNYLAFRADEELDRAEITEQDTESYYRQNIERYTQQERRQARHILFKTSGDDPETIRADKKKQAEEVLAMVKAGEKDFSELAKQYSEGPTAPRGGDLGFFSRGQMVKPFEDAIFAMAEGATSDLVETPFGYHIIKLEKIQPFRIKPLEEVKTDIQGELKKNKAKSLAFTRANKAYEEIILAGSLAKYGETSGAEILQTDFFERSSPPDVEGKNSFVREPAFLSTAFALKKGELSSLVDLGEGYAIIFAQDKKAPKVSPLEEIREQVRADYIGKRSEELARETADTLLDAVRALQDKGGDWLPVLSKNNLIQEETGFVSRSGSRNEQARILPPTAIAKGFSLSAENPFPEEIAVSGHTFMVYRFKDRKEPAPELFEEKREEIENRLQEEKKFSIMSSWIGNLKDKAEIAINEQYL